MVVFQLVLRSRFTVPGSSPTTGRHKLFELCGLGIPSLSLGGSFEGSEMALPKAFGEVGILLGVLVFVVFQWIAFSRHFIAISRLACVPLYAALFWSTLLLDSDGLVLLTCLRPLLGRAIFATGASDFLIPDGRGARARAGAIHPWLVPIQSGGGHPGDVLRPGLSGLALAACGNVPPGKRCHVSKSRGFFRGGAVLWLVAAIE
jgi:hypothetical protein